MSSLVFPYTLPGIQYKYGRKYDWGKTGFQRAVTGVQATLRYQPFPLVNFEYSFGTPGFLRDYTNPPEISALVGLINAVGGRYDTFLHTDPDFNTVSGAAPQQFATGDGTTTQFQLTATYTAPGGASSVGAPEMIQNLNGAAIIYRQDWQAPNAPGQQLSQISRTNFLLYSQAWSTANWTLVACTAGAAVSAPDGTTTALLVDETTASATQHAINQTDTGLSATINLPYTLSAWVKGATRTQCFLQMTENTGSTFSTAVFNLTGAGSIASTNTGANWSGAAATITAYPGGWYRVTLTATKTNAATSITSWIGGAVGGSNSYTGVVGDGVYAWGMQLEGFNGVGAYIPTTSAQRTVVDASIGATGLVTFGIAPVLAAACSWSGSFYYRCRFDQDSYDFSKFMKGLWRVDKVTFTSVILS